jgi:hypothetical protein
MQTIAHLRGLASLRGSIPFLRQFPFEHLYLVTNAHGHALTQFYIPGYGWLDFEATSFAIPPLGGGDISNWDVVIPLMNENRTFTQVRKFPWYAVTRAVGFLAFIGLLCAYILRYGREAILYMGVRRGEKVSKHSSAARSLYLLLLAKLAADGKPIKPASKTALEFADLFPSQDNFSTSLSAPHFVPHLAHFAALYTELRWRNFKNDTEKKERFIMLKQEYVNILKTSRRRGLPAFIIRIFSLRGLAYL